MVGDLAVQVAIAGSNNSGSGTVIPDEPDVLDADDVVDGAGVDGWRRVRRVVGKFLILWMN